MKVHLNQIPSDGLHLEGEEASTILDLDGADARAEGPLHYALDVGLSENGLFATGTLEVPLTLRCVSCLENFSLPLKVDDFACRVELTGAETVDLTEYLREDTLLALPPHPHCDWNGERDCKGIFRDRSETADEPLTSPREVWGVLDNLNLS